MSLLAQLDQRIRHHGGLIVSCQPVPGSPLDNPAIVAAMALAAEQAEAVAAAHRRPGQPAGRSSVSDSARYWVDQTRFAR